MQQIAQRQLSTGDVAVMFDVHPATIRRWEREGVIPPAKRRRGLRVYSADDVERIREAVYAQPANMKGSV